MKTCLVVGAHPDDMELGCCATVLSLIEREWDVWSLALADNTLTVVGQGFDDCHFQAERQEAAQVLGIPQDRLLTHRFPVRDFPAHRQDILEHLYKMVRDMEPEMVLCPSSTDINQDHLVVYEETVRACTGIPCSIFGYYLPWNNRQVGLTFFSSFTEKYMSLKEEALACYRSQAHRPYMRPGAARAFAQAMGTCSYVLPLAEPLEPIRCMLCAS